MADPPKTLREHFPSLWPWRYVVATGFLAGVGLMFLYHQTHQAAELLTAAASWPVAVMVGVVVLRGALRYAIRTLADRMTGAKVGATAVTFGGTPGLIQQSDTQANRLQELLEAARARAPRGGGSL